MTTRMAMLKTVAAATLLALAGCGESVTPTVYEPGVYKGERDPFLAMHAEPEHKEMLQQRFAMGQSDR